MRRVVLVNRFFHPDHSATSQMASDLAFHLASAGWDVTAITGRLHYENAAPVEAPGTTRGVKIVRIWTSRFGRRHLLGRAIDYATFYGSAFFALLRELRRGDSVIAMTDPPLISVVAAAAVGIRGARLMNWLQDLFPDIAAALGMRIPPVARWLRDWSLRVAKVNVAISESMAARIPNAHVRENWAPAVLHPVGPAANALRREWSLSNRFIIGYSGNLGRAHDVATITSAMDLLRAEDVEFLFIGAGAQMEAIRTAADARVTFRPYQPLERLSESLSAADAHIVSLKRSVEGLLLPSKLYGVLAVARPVIFIGDPMGEIAQLIARHRCGIAVAEGDAAALAEAIRRLAQNRSESEAMGARGKALYDAKYAPSHAFAAWEAILESGE